MSHSSPIPTPGTPATLHNDYSDDPERGSRRPATITSETATLDSPAPAKDTVPERDRELFFIPIPKHLRHDPENPPHFGLMMNILFGIASTFCEY